MKIKLISLFLLPLLLASCGSNNQTIYHSKEEWDKRYDMFPYEENKEITGDYPRSLAATCNNGTFVGTLDKELNVKSWRGVPFATIPGRFERSIAPSDSNKVYEAYHFGKVCMQEINQSEMASLYPQDDLDCLNLSISTYNNTKGNKPVLVYIHGGGWVSGGAPDPLYDSRLFAYYNPNMVIVNIQYRINYMGMINLVIKDDQGNYILSDYSEKFKTSTNNGLLDQIQALRWIKKNIASFGGDPNNITISGESAGCGAVYCLLTMESDPNNHYLEKDEHLFNKAIAMSGGINQGTSLKSSESLTYKFLNDHPNVHTISDIQALPLSDLQNWRHENSLYINNYILDGEVIPLDMYQTFNQYIDKDITVLTGATTNEFAYYKVALAPVIASNPKYSFENICKSIYEMVSGEGEDEYHFTPTEEFINARNLYMASLEEEGIINQEDKIKEFVNDFTLQGFNYYLGLKQIRNNGHVYSYSFDIPYDGKLASLKAAHAIDCSYTFGNFDGLYAYGENKQVDASRKWQNILSNFCENGNPSVDDLSFKEYGNENSCAYIGLDTFKIVNNWKVNRYNHFVTMVDNNPMMKYVTPWTKVFSHIDKTM